MLDKKENKLKYESPVIVPLGGMAKGAGANCTVGSSASDYCSSGVTATNGYCTAGTTATSAGAEAYCSAGTAATSYCTSSGTTAGPTPTGACTTMGNTASGSNVCSAGGVVTP